MADMTMEQLRILLNHCLTLTKPKAGSPPEMIQAFAQAAQALLEVIKKIEAEQ